MDTDVRSSKSAKQGGRRAARAPATRLTGNRRAASRALALAVIALLVVLAAVSTGFGATTDIPYDATRVEAPDPQAGARFGDRMVPAGDIDGDRVSDFWVGVYQHDLGAAQNAGRVYAMSGKDRSVIYRIDSPEPQSDRAGFSGFGWSVTNLGDVDGDRRDDLAVGSVAHDVSGNPDQGKAWVFSGAKGTVLYALDNPVPQPRGAFGWVGTAGDVTGDGVSEVLVGAYQNDVPAGCGEASGFDPANPGDCRKNQGQAFVFNGKTGALLPGPRGTLDIPASDRQPPDCNTAVLSPPGTTCGELGIVAQGPGDVDRDRVPDQLVTAWTFNQARGRMYLFSGRTGGVIRRIDSPEPQVGGRFGLQIVEPGAPGDVNGDGRADIYGNGFLQNGPAGAAQGRSWVFDGGTGGTLYQLDDPTPEDGGQFGYSLARTDYDRDGKPDLYIGQSPHHGSGSPQIGGSYVFDGQGGGLLKALELPASDRQPGVASPRNLGSQLGRAVVAPGDLDRDGQADYIASAPTMDVSSQDVGRLYVFLSRLAAGRCKTEVLGTSRPDRLTGTRAGDRLVGRAHNDRLLGLQGADCLIGNSGSDLLVGGSGNDRILGAAGRDRLSGGPGRDSIVGGPGVNRYSGGSGNDKIEAANGRPERVNCGRGRDTVRADHHDRLIGCERVKETRLVRR